MDLNKISQNFATLFEQNRWIMKSLQEIQSDVKALNGFKMKVIGMGIMAGFFGSAVLEIAIRVLGK